MALNPVHSSQGSLQPSPVARPAGEGSPVETGGRGVADTVRLSDRGRMLSKLPEMAAPTPENVRKLSATLASELGGLFRGNSVDIRRDVVFEVDLQNGKVSVKADRADAGSITDLISSQPKIERQIYDIAVLSRHVFVAEQGADTRLANRMAKIGSIVADYASRFNDKTEPQDFSPVPALRTVAPAGISSAIANYNAMSDTSSAVADISLLFNGKDVHVLANGKPWLSSGA